jgi:hypothetical protein
MPKYNVTVLNSQAVALLEALARIKFIMLTPAEQKTAKEVPEKKPRFTANLDTRGFKFNRDEANER